MSDPKHTIHTERLTLIPYAPEHEDALFAMNSDPEVARYLGKVHTREDTRERIAQAQERWKTLGFSWWSLFLRDTDTLIGAACVQHVAQDERAPLEIGWRLMTAYQGKGYATEAGRAAMAFGFEVVGAKYLVAVTDPENIASAKVMQRLGMTDAGIQRHYDMDCVTYEIRMP